MMASDCNRNNNNKEKKIKKKKKIKRKYEKFSRLYNFSLSLNILSACKPIISTENFNDSYTGKAVA